VASVGAATVSYVLASCGGEVTPDSSANGGPDGNRFDLQQPKFGDGGNVDALQPVYGDGNMFDVNVVDAAEASSDANPEGG